MRIQQVVKERFAKIMSDIISVECLWLVPFKSLSQP